MRFHRRLAWAVFTFVLAAAPVAGAQTIAEEAKAREMEIRTAEEAGEKIACTVIAKAHSVASLILLGTAAEAVADSSSPDKPSSAAVLVPIEAVEANAIVRVIAGYEVWGTAESVGASYSVDILGLWATKNSEGLFALFDALKSEARAAGATEIRIVGRAILDKNQTFFSPRAAARFGLQVECVDAETVVLSGKV